MTTPDVELDVIRYLAAQLPAAYVVSGARTNAFVGAEVPGGGEVPRVALFARLVGERSALYHGGQSRWFDVQLLQRFDAKDRSDHRARARALYDLLHMRGFTGASGTVYIDALYLDAPLLMTDAYYAHNVSLLADV